ncbi:nucleoside-diphosphate-sugar epimerase [Hamadaea flava]|uniref:NAD-dependent epimerase/dehydratase family protein n=1 Tax=Hamadaea flava TaxID=1742688 RepID=A0ABV8LMQ0_9ACTN|nr:NAD(P)-dependent oxidoreductase [Hamadaea flava]MCP2323160.1 nucleoside-diphosphate-sugar epimerase [Hamadaea flava]
MNRILLLGASGFLGGHVHRALLDHPRLNDVSCPGRDRCDLITASVGDITRLLNDERPAAVVNCTGRLDGDLADLVLANTVVTAKLLDAIAVTNAPIRLVRLGSAGEYGPIPFHHSVTETHPAQPVGAYGLSHLTATHLVSMAAAAGRVDGVTLRVFNPIGTGSGDASLLGRATTQLRQAVSGGWTSMTFGPLSAYRDFVDARDVASAVVAALLAPRLPVRVLNVGSGRAVQTRAAVQTLARLAGFTGEIKETGASSARSAEVSWTCADISHAGSILDWRPAHDLDESLKALWAGSAGA